ncbi:hypothetical protein EBZ80_04950 [bacterium]|nr:hypothetical protein [bacterium]
MESQPSLRPAAGKYTLIRQDDALEKKGQRRRQSMIQIEDKQKELDQILRQHTKPEIEEVKQAQERLEKARKEFVAKQQKLMQKAKTVSETNQEFKKKHREYETLASAHPEVEEEFRREAVRYISETQQIIQQDKTLSKKDQQRAMDEIIQYLKSVKMTPSEAAFIDKITQQFGKGDGIIVISAGCADGAAAAFEGPDGLFLR